MYYEKTLLSAFVYIVTCFNFQLVHTTSLSPTLATLVDVFTATQQVEPENIFIKVSISSTFYEQLFHSKVYCATFMCLQFGFVIFWQINMGVKFAHKMLAKSTPRFKICIIILKNIISTVDFQRSQISIFAQVYQHFFTSFWHLKRYH